MRAQARERRLPHLPQLRGAHRLPLRVLDKCKAFFPSLPGCVTPLWLPSSHPVILLWFHFHFLPTQSPLIITGQGHWLLYLFFLSLWLGNTSPQSLRVVSVHGILPFSDSEWATSTQGTSVPWPSSLLSLCTAAQGQICDEGDMARYNITRGLLWARNNGRHLK